MKRREVLLASTGLGFLGLTACQSTFRGTRQAAIKPRPHYPAVKATAERVIQTVVGLRPFRPQGYRLEAERVDDKVLVHNYGHGGAGITLSWGSSLAAAAMAAETGQRDIAILGAGVMGLTTALILSRQGHRVTLYAADFPPNTTSNIAAALWLPTSYFDRSVVSPQFIKQDEALIRRSFRRFLGYVNRPGYGVYWNDYHLLLPEVPSRNRPQPGGNDLYPELSFSTSQNLFDFPYQKRMKVMMIDPSLYLERILTDAQLAGTQLQAMQFDHLGQVMELSQKTIVNCTGLGAATLFGDEQLVPVQGQLTHLLPQAEVNYSYVTPTPEGYLYMFPRTGSLVLGGTSVKGAYSTEPDMALARQMIAGHARLARRLGDAAHS